MKTLSTIVLMLFASLVQAEWEIAPGHSEFTIQPDGTWYQNPYPHNIKSSSESIAIGWTDYATEGIRYHIGAEYLGGCSSVAVAVASDPIYARYGINASKYIGLGTWYGSGNVKMIYGSIAPEVKVGNWTAAIELGLTIYRPSWQEQVINYQTGIGSPIISNTFRHNPRLEIGKSIGVSLGYKDVDFVVTAYPGVNAAGDEYPAIYKGLVTNFAMRYKF